MPKLKITFVVNHAAFFVSHRLPIALSARDAGYRISLVIGQAGSDMMEREAVSQLVKENILHNRAVFHSSGMNPFLELFGILQLIWFMFRFKPDIVHCASPKGVLYGGIAANICGIKGLVLAISGMGYAFTTTEKKSLVRIFINKIYSKMFNIILNHPNVRIIVQNTDDELTLNETFHIKKKQMTLIPGSGVNIEEFSNCSAEEKESIVLFPARILRDKGVVEFVESAKQLKLKFPNWRFVLAGAADYKNPSAVSLYQLNLWQQDGSVEWLGHVGNMVPLFKSAAIVCLPSYREGMPKVLLEASAASCAIVTTDVPGCREAIISGVTGELVPVYDSIALAEAIKKLIEDKQKRIAYGKAGKQLAISKYSINTVVDKTVEIYRSLAQY